MAERNIGPVSKIHGAGFPPELTPFIPPDTWHIIRTRLSSAHVRASDSFGSTCCCCYERYAREELRKACQEINRDYFQNKPLLSFTPDGDIIISSQNPTNRPPIQQQSNAFPPSYHPNTNTIYPAPASSQYPQHQQPPPQSVPQYPQYQQQPPQSVPQYTQYNQQQQPPLSVPQYTQQQQHLPPQYQQPPQQIQQSSPQAYYQYPPPQYTPIHHNAEPPLIQAIVVNPQR